MEVREPSAKYLAAAAFKQTEIGVIPEDWEPMPLGELCVFENGDRSSNYPAGNDFASSGTPFINAGHVEGGKIDLRRMDFITYESYSRLTRGKVKSGDILYCLRGSLGKYGIIPEGFGNGAIASSLVIVRPKQDNLCREYLLSYFGSGLCDQMIEVWAGGAAQPNLGVQDLANFVLPIPPSLAEQQAIATALSDADALIESLEQLLTKKRQIKQGAMQELLTAQRRLPGFDGEWQEKAFSDLFDFSGGFTASREQLGVDGYCYLHYGDIHIANKNYIDVDNEFQDLPKLDVPLKKINKASFLADGDVVFVDASEDDEGTSKHLVAVVSG